MKTEITFSEFEIIDMIKKHLLAKGYKLEEARDQQDVANYRIVIVNNSVVVTIGN